MNEDQTRLTKAYKRAGLGLALAALLWTAAFLFGGLPNEEKTHWLIPIAIAALSVLFFSRYAKSKQSPD
jgi:hypothetical protein